MAPAISLAYENGELDIMERMPRSAKLDHLVTKKLIAFSYMVIGMQETLAGMLTYFYVFNDYGFPFTTAMFLNGNVGYIPNDSDIYDPAQPNYGNTNYGVAGSYSTIDWGYQTSSKLDLRLFFSYFTKVDYSRCRWDPFDESIPHHWRISPYTDD